MAWSVASFPPSFTLEGKDASEGCLPLIEVGTFFESFAGASPRGAHPSLLNI
jgi:hypothetical protein